MRILLAAIVLLLAAAAYGACDAPRNKLTEGSTLSETRPLIGWEPVTGATAYRVKLLSRVPNGKVLASHDAVVSVPAWVAPQPLAEQQAKVVLRLSAICAGAVSTESVVSFEIDASPGCRLDGIDARRTRSGAEVQWKPVPQAHSYEVRASALIDGKLLASNETRSTAARLDLKERHHAVVSVRPSCPGGSGEAAYRVLAAD